MASDTKEVQLAIAAKWKNITKMESKELVQGAEQYGALYYLNHAKIYHSAHEVIQDCLSNAVHELDISLEDYLSYFSEHYPQLSKAEWDKIINKKILTKDREYVYKMVLTLALKEDDLFKILNAIDGELVRRRDPKEIIYYIALRNEYTYDHAKSLLEAYDKKKKAIYGDDVKYKKEEMKSGNSFLLTYDLSGDLEGDNRLVDKLVSLLPQINEDSARYSITNAQKFVRLIQYVWVKYPFYEVVVSNLEGEESTTSKWKEQTKRVPVGIYVNHDRSITIPFLPDALALYKAATLLQHQHRANTSVNDSVNSNFVKTKKIIKDIYKKPSINVYQKYNLLLGAIPADRAKPGDQQYGRVRRADVLLYVYFLIRGYEIDSSYIMKNDLPKAESDADLSNNFKEAMKADGVWEKFDESMQEIQDDIVNVLEGDDTEIARLEEYIDILNGILSLFGFSEIYPRNCIDAYFLSLLMSDDPELDWPIETVLE